MIECPKCGESDIYDAADQHCWRCGYGYQKPVSLWLRVLLFPLFLIVQGLG